MVSPLHALIDEPTKKKRLRGTFFTPSEICRQFGFWEETIKVAISNRAEIDEMICRADEIVLTGAGSSHFLGKVIEGELQRCLGKRVSAVPATLLTTHPDFLAVPERDVLMVSFSRSGDSPESVHAIDYSLANYPQVAHLIVTCNREGTMARRFRGKNVRVMTLPGATCDKALAMTASVTNMIVAGGFLGYVDRAEEYIALVGKAARCGEAALDGCARRAHEIARRKYPRVLLLGSGALHGAALEGALKITELTDGRIAAMGESFLGVRHGPLTFVDEDTVVIYMLSRDPAVRRYEEDLIVHVHGMRLGAARVALGSAISRRVSRCVDTVIDFHCDLPDMIAAPLHILFPQLLGLFSSLEHGLRPDDPSRRGVITKVVSGVKIYPMPKRKAVK